MKADRFKKDITVGIVAPSKALEEEHKKYLENFKDYLEKEFNIKTVYGKNIFEKDKFGIAAGTPEQRAQDVNEMFKDPNIDVVWCYQGGGSAIQMLDLIDYDLIKENPKPFLGMSDVDVLLLAIYAKTGLVTFNTPDAKRGRDLDLDFEYSRKSFVERMFDTQKTIKPNTEWKTLKEGKATGKILGCNITSILKLNGTSYFPDFENSILFLEAYRGNPQEMQWKLEQLKKIGVFDKIKGFVVGYMYTFQDEQQRTENAINVEFEDILLEATKEYNFPILKINEFGHRCQNTFLPIGVEVELDATNKTLEITEDFLH